MAGRGFFRIWRRFRPLPGFSINLSKSGLSASVGPRGAQYTVGPRGTRSTLGIPGTGFYWTSHNKGSASRASSAGQQASPLPAPYSIASFLTPAHIKNTIRGMEAIADNDAATALEHLVKAPDSPDANYLAGFVCLAHGDGEAAAEFFMRARREVGYLEHMFSEHELGANLGRTFAEYGLDASLIYKLGYDVKVRIHPDASGLAIGLAESYLLTNQINAACATLQDAIDADRQDHIARAFLVRILWHRPDRNPEHMNDIMAAAAGIDNETALESYLLLYRARALRALDLLTGALETARAAAKRRKDRPQILLVALKIDQALTLEASGNMKQSLGILETVYGDCPNYPGLRAMIEMHRQEPMS